MKPVLLLMLAPLAACGGTEAPPSDPVAVDCGTFDLGQGEAVPVSAFRCLLDSARPTRLTVTSPTTEGDPITVTYTARGNDGRFEVVTDNRKDRFGDKTITHDTCTGPAVAPGGLTFDSCTPNR